MKDTIIIIGNDFSKTTYRISNRFLYYFYFYLEKYSWKLFLYLKRVNAKAENEKWKYLVKDINGD